MSTVHVTFILNDKSGSGAAKKAEDVVRRAAMEHGAKASIHTLTPGSDIAGLVRKAVDEGAQIVVGGGGDGTISAVAAALIGRDVPMGVLPLGTLNHFAKDAKIPLDLDDALANVFEGEAMPIDVGEVNGRYFINNSGIGLYPAIVRDREAIQRSGRSKWSAMAVATVHKLMAYSNIRVALTMEDGQQLDRWTPFVFVGNNRFDISGPQMGQRQRLNGGRLWICLAPKAGRLKLAAIVVRAFFARLREDDLEAFDATQILISSRRKRQEMSQDGEVVLVDSPLKYKSLPSALRVIVPRKSPGGTVPQ